MPSPLTAMRQRSPLVPLLVGLACAQAACNLGSLDYLQNGTKRDGGVGDGQGTSNQDSTSPDEALLADKPDGTVLDTKAIEAPLGLSVGVQEPLVPRALRQVRTLSTSKLQRELWPPGFPVRSRCSTRHKT